MPNSNTQNLKLSTFNSTFQFFLNNNTDESVELIYSTDKIATRKSLPKKDHKNKETYIKVLNNFISANPAELNLTFKNTNELISQAKIILSHYETTVGKPKSEINISKIQLLDIGKKTSVKKPNVIEDIGDVSDFIKSKKPIKISPLLNMSDIIVKKIKSIGLVPKGKAPTSDWFRSGGRFINRGNWKTTTFETLNDLGDMGQNRGIPCGKINKCFVIDLDFYDKVLKDGTVKEFNKDNDFIKTFGTIEEIKNNLKDITYVVETARGGLHLYFQYDPLILQTINAEFGIDIKTDGGYVVSAGATVILNGVEGKYKQVSSTTEFAICPEDLLDWVKINLVTNKVVSKPIKERGITIDKDDNIIEEDWEAYEQDEIDLSSYRYTMSDSEMRGILDGLPDKYFTDYPDWLKYSTMMKTLGLKELWDEYNKSRGGGSYDKTNNLKQWKKLRFRNYNCIDHCFHHSSFFVAEGGDNATPIKDFLGYYQFKPTDCHNTVPDIEIKGKRYLDGDEKGSFIAKYKNRIIIVRSDTGTGKTTAFKNHIQKKIKNGEECPFISIVSRISLGEEQQRVLTDAGIECHFYQDIKDWRQYEGDNIIITIDSLMKMNCWFSNDDEYNPFEEYTLYLDEYNSLLEYFLSCPNLDTKRLFVYKMLNKMVSTALCVIATDADINDTAIEYFKTLPTIDNKDIKYITNDYKHNNGLPCVELPKYELMRDRLLQLDKFMVCCDSKKVAEKIFYDLTVGWEEDGEMLGGTKSKNNVCLITSETGSQKVNLDDWDMVIFSPKIVYGLDSVMEREVFAYMKGQTITPPAMVQQICRCRNIIKLSYIFEDKRWKTYKYHSLQDVKDEMDAGIIEFSKEFKLLGLVEDQKHFNNLYASYLYTVDCYDTNFLAHFRNIILKRGFLPIKQDDIIYTPKMETLGNSHIKKVKEFKMIELSEFINAGMIIYNEKYGVLSKDYKKWRTMWKSQYENMTNDKDIDENVISEMKIISDKHECLQHISLDYFDGSLEDEDYMVEYKEQKNRIKKQSDILRDEALLAVNIPKTWGDNINLLNIPMDKIMDFCEFVQDPHRLEQYFVAKGFFGEKERDYKSQLENMANFDAKKLTSDRHKLIFLNKLLKLGDSESKLKYDARQGVGLMEAKSLYKECCEIKRVRISKKNPFETKQGISSEINKLYKQLFGEKMVATKKTTQVCEDTGKKKSLTIHTVNGEEIGKVWALEKFAPSKY